MSLEEAAQHEWLANHSSLEGFTYQKGRYQGTVRYDCWSDAPLEAGSGITTGIGGGRKTRVSGRLTNAT